MVQVRIKPWTVGGGGGRDWVTGTYKIIYSAIVDLMAKQTYKYSVPTSTMFYPCAKSERKQFMSQHSLAVSVVSVIGSQILSYQHIIHHS